MTLSDDFTLPSDVAEVVSQIRVPDSTYQMVANDNIRIDAVSQVKLSIPILTNCVCMFSSVHTYVLP